LHDANRYVRRNAAEALGNIKNKSATGRLIESLQDPDVDVRWNAADALGKLRDQSATDPLIHALSDPDEFVRERAANALGKIRDVSAAAALQAALNDSHEDVRKTAAEALEKIELRDARSLPGLGAMVRDRCTLKTCNVFKYDYAVTTTGSMADTLSTMGEVDRAVAAIKQIKERTAKLPPVLVEAYRETLESASSAIVRRFFEGLANQCPDALEYFIDVDKQKKADDEKQTKLDTIS
jgi:hypothetical protein